MKIKKILTIFIALVAILAFYFVKNNIDHVSLNDISARKASKNEIKLYKQREKYDPAFAIRAIIPTSNIEIDVVIPMVERDIVVAGYTIEAIRKLVSHNIREIYIISPESENMRAFAKKQNCTFILEDDILPSNEIRKQGGWIVQQFLKLSADKVVKADHYLVVDADTVFLRPVIFEEKGTYFINAHWDFAPNRKKMTSLILGNDKAYQYDFVSHNMLFSKSILANMKKHITDRFDKSWDLAIMELISKDGESRYSFSEYDLYATYLTEFSGVKFRFLSNANITVYRNFLDRLDKIIPAYSHQYKSISLHHFILFKK